MYHIEAYSSAARRWIWLAKFPTRREAQVQAARLRLPPSLGALRFTRKRS